MTSRLRSALCPVIMLAATLSPLASGAQDCGTWKYGTVNPGGDGVAYGGGTTLVLGAQGQATEIAVQHADGAWRFVAGPSLLRVAWGAGRFVGVSSNGIWVSSDGLAWTNTLTVGAGLVDVAWNGSQFAAAGPNAVLTSPDGSNWTSSDLPAGANLGRITGGGPRWVAVGSGSLFASTDGVTWTQPVSVAGFGFSVVAWDGSRDVPVAGFYAAGECGCASVHGANRLGTNSLTDLLVFGRSAGRAMLEFIRREGEALPELPKDAAERSRMRVGRLDGEARGEDVNEVRNEIQRTMQAHCGVFRFPDLLARGVEKIRAISERAGRTQIKDKSKVFNTARVEALELDNLVETARASMISAAAREESRGAHDRADFHKRDDVNWLKHTLWHRDGDRLAYKPVHLKPLTVETFQPKARVY